MVFGQPISVVPPLFGVLGQIEGIAECPGGRAAGGDGRKVENRKRNHNALLINSTSTTKYESECPYSVSLLHQLR